MKFVEIRRCISKKFRSTLAEALIGMLKIFKNIKEKNFEKKIYNFVQKLAGLQVLSQSCFKNFGKKSNLSY
ncbi:hypothetical protein BpHYR1_016387 [Brachionus plicatilis]|uniref:Uncharacterized protein n=1 Tax=Brachionus plicatilis TaxID=10195 RepID=A0A3M7SWT1_BRAPC|nr:hypothetical protein BpHYR1_016387 [Brachionus plicatilis]